MPNMPNSERRFVYICFPGEGKAGEYNRAVEYCRLVAALGHIPLTGSIMLHGILDNSSPEHMHRKAATALLLIDAAEELWVFGTHITRSMAMEILYALESGKTVINYFEEISLAEECGGWLHKTAVDVLLQPASIVN